MSAVGFNRPLSRMRKLETKETLFRARKRTLKYLVLGFLREEGCKRAAEAFAEEAELSPQYDLCDNIDLDIILQEYCSYYMMKFNKQPVFCKKVEDKPTTAAPVQKKPVAKKNIFEETCNESEKLLELLQPLTVTQLTRETEDDDDKKPITTKPLAGFVSNANYEKREIAKLLCQDIIRSSPIKWDDVKGLDSAKGLLLESVIYPVKYPDFFTGILEPWRGILLHGPPGTGKTMLAKAVANESKCTFFNVTSSTLVNKWRGESEKIVKVLFELAAYYSPSVVFVDELDSLASERDAGGEHEASRRLKSQLLTELDGISERGGKVFLLACSNIPWDIDSAMLRRLEKRIHVPLPDLNTRACMFKSFLSSKSVALEAGADLREAASRTVGYSGSDVKLVCREAVMAAVRNVLPDLCHKGDMTAKHRLTAKDLQTAIAKTKPISRSLAEKHIKWQNDMGSC